MGAWIETLTCALEVAEICKSHPTWVRGLKLSVKSMVLSTRSVAPYVGAWIETPDTAVFKKGSEVAPYVGAWIETNRTSRTTFCKKSHPTWVRGLKLKR